MCTGVEIALVAGSVLASGASAYSQYSAASSQAAYQQYEMTVQNQQLAQDAKNAEIQAMEQENARLQASRETMSSNRATLAAFGQSSNASFLMGATEADRRALTTGVADIRLGLGTSLSRLSDQIGVNRYSASNAGYGASMAGFNAIGSIGASLAQGGSYLSRYGTPSTQTFRSFPGMEDRAGRLA